MSSRTVIIENRIANIQSFKALNLKHQLSCFLEMGNPLNTAKNLFSS